MAAEAWREALLESGFRMNVMPTDLRQPLLEGFDQDEDSGEQPGPKDSPPKPPSFRRLVSIASGEVFWIACGLLALLFRLPFTLAVPHYVSVAIAAALAGDKATAVRGIKLFCAAGLVDSAGDFGNCIFFYYAQQRIVRRVRNDLMAAILRQEVAFFDKASSGELASRLSSDCNQLSSDLTWVFRFTLEAVVRVVGVTAYLFWAQWQLGLIAVVLVPVFSYASKIYGKIMEDNAAKVQTASAKANEVAQDAICSFRTVLSFAGEAFERLRYAECVQRSFALNMRQGVLQSVYYALVNTFLTRVVLQGAFLLVGCLLVLDGEMAPARLIAVMIYQSNLAESFGNLLNSAASLFRSSGAAAAVFALLDRKGPDADRALATARPQPTGVVEFSGVHFAYPSRAVPVLRGISLRALPGTVTALVGPSGAGKSTVFHLLERFYEPSEGSVLIDGADVRTVSHAWLHSVVGLVAQEPVLFRCSVGENIAYSRNCARAADAEERARTGRVADAPHSDAPSSSSASSPSPVVTVESAAEMANAHGFISAMPLGYATEVGERGVQLSGGQRQRIAIARAIFQDPRVLLLDEATSALDTESEALLQEALLRAMENRTVLVIAHRLSTIAGADAILVLHGGRVVEAGTHAELMARPRSAAAGPRAAGGVPHAPSYRSLVEGDALARAEAEAAAAAEAGEAAAAASGKLTEEALLRG